MIDLAKLRSLAIEATKVLISPLHKTQYERALRINEFQRAANPHTIIELCDEIDECKRIVEIQESTIRGLDYVVRSNPSTHELEQLRKDAVDYARGISECRRCESCRTYSLDFLEKYKERE